MEEHFYAPGFFEDWSIDDVKNDETVDELLALTETHYGKAGEPLTADRVLLCILEVAGGTVRLTDEDAVKKARRGLGKRFENRYTEFAEALRAYIAADETPLEELIAYWDNRYADTKNYVTWCAAGKVDLTSLAVLLIRKPSAGLIECIKTLGDREWLRMAYRVNGMEVPPEDTED